MPRPDVRTVSYMLDVPQWPAGFSLSVALLSDIHLGAHMRAARLERIVHHVNAMQCDVIAVLGDIVDYKTRSRREPAALWAPALAQLRGAIAVAGVVGNHDWKSGIEVVRDAMRDAAIPLLNNTALRFEKGDQPFWIAGMDSQLGGFAVPGATRRGHHDIDAALAAITDDAPALMLMHEPDIFDALPGRFAVAFAGHTHGGQINLPLIGRPAVHLFPHRFVRHVYGHGVSHCGQRQMVVTSGVGYSGLPIRIGVPPEVVRVDLRGTRI